MRQGDRLASAETDPNPLPEIRKRGMVRILGCPRPQVIPADERWVGLGGGDGSVRL